MVEVPGVALPRTGRTSRVATRVVRPGLRQGANIATRERIRSRSLALSEARRAWNRDRVGLVSALVCECARPNCRSLVPAVAEQHRWAGQFVVAPAHFDGGDVVRAADRFFVVVIAA